MTDGAARHLLDIAWAAGLYEGEGTCLAQGRGGNQPTLSLRLQSCDEDVLRRYHDIVGCGGVVGPHQALPNRKPHWRWAVYREGEAIDVLRAFWPWLGERRKAQAWRAIEARGVRMSRDEWLMRVRAGKKAEWELKRALA